MSFLLYMVYTKLSSEQVERYKRHLLLDGVGPDGQLKILNGRVLVVGAGGLGSPVALYLAAAGVGTIGLIDADVVSLSNLQRQVIHFTSNLGELKVESARRKIEDVNPDVRVVAHAELLTADNAETLFAQYDFIVDCTDNFPVKFLINDVCVRMGKPFSHGGILRFQGETFTHLPGTACYRCLFSEPDVSKADGLFGAVAGMLGTIQAAEVLKYFSGVGQLLTNRLLTFDALAMQYRTLNFKPNPSCPVCSKFQNKT